MAHWLLVERLENWQIDKEEGFKRFGLPERKKRLADQIRRGDTLIFYISSGISVLADIREATEDATRKLAYGGDYDTAFPIFISTRPHLTLNRAQWVPFRALAPNLSITTGKTDWRQVMRTSLLPLNEDDATIIVSAMKTASISL